MISSVAIGECVQPVKKWDPAKDSGRATFRYIDIASVSQEQKIILPNGEIPVSEAPSRARQLIESGDVLVSTVRPNLNAVALVPEGLSGSTASTGFCVLRPDNNRIDSNYLFYWVMTPNFVSEMVKQATGQSYPAVSDKIIKESLIPLPSVKEQKRIAKILDQADSLRCLRQRAIDRLNTLGQSIFYEMFGKDNGSSRSNIAALVDCTETIQIGPFGSVLHKSDYIDGGVPLINPMHISNGRIHPNSSFSVSPEKHASLARYQLRAGDVIMGRRGEMGRCAVVSDAETGFLCGTGSLYLRPRTDMLRPIYLQAFLSSSATVAKLEKAAAGVTMANLNSSFLKTLDLPLPPISQQTCFEEALHQSEFLQRSQQKHRASADIFFRSLQHRAFNGEL